MENQKSFEKDLAEAKEIQKYLKKKRHSKPKIETLLLYVIEKKRYLRGD